jgi:hypothetical protein
MSKELFSRLIGPALLFVGLILPTANTQVGQQSPVYVLNSSYLALPMIFLCLAGVVVVFRFPTKYLTGVGIGSLAVTVVDFLEFFQWMQINNDARNAVKYSILGGLVSDDILTIVEPGVSWIFLIGGSLVCIAIPFLKLPANTSSDGR